MWVVYRKKEENHSPRKRNKGEEEEANQVQLYPLPPSWKGVLVEAVLEVARCQWS